MILFFIIDPGFIRIYQWVRVWNPYDFNQQGHPGIIRIRQFTCIWNPYDFERKESDIEVDGKKDHTDSYGLHFRKMSVEKWIPGFIRIGPEIMVPWKLDRGGIVDSKKSVWIRMVPYSKIWDTLVRFRRCELSGLIQAPFNSLYHYFRMNPGESGAIHTFLGLD